MNAKLGICHWSCPIDGPYALKMASELGLEGIQLDIGSYERGFPLSRPSIQKAYVEYAKKYNITITSLAVRELDRHGMTRKDGTMEKKIAVEAILKAISALKNK